LRTRLLRQTELAHDGSSNELLASLVSAVGGKTYLVGGGAEEYHDDRPFERFGISVVKQQFENKAYGSADRFVPGLSVLDYLMHDGRPLAEVSHPETRPA
jgi:hypothetical protein